MSPKLDESWFRHLASEFSQPYMQALQAFLQQQKEGNLVTFPAEPLIFNAFNRTPLPAVKVVILGQDPYHGAGQAHGLSFSVPDGIKPPPSLVNIFKEIQQDLAVTNCSGNLSSWADQGVLLLNSVLTVEQARAASHQGKGWEIFTDRVIQIINDQSEGVVFMLWGAYAQQKGRHVDPDKHCILQAPHPSPLSAYRGFLGCRHFSKCNQYLINHAKTPINWQIS
ncbi:uracil-DNA glycosylase [Marinicella litoralis]|uniref:Uracil-DNA glycosylase n=1 Tax=Marinicella litoralis TaxID=644220 RepID=A0A4R6XS03_9GAMM|nr:uracil-DNA glycosylase [Marinicella litoralis]TDR22702.1 uracil-DNA glycosylase [Marinicella litoralis]